MSDPKREADVTQEYVPLVKYLCVCGNEASIGPGSDSTCASCGRRFPASLLERDPALTVDVAAAGLGTNESDGLVVNSRIGEVLGHYRVVNALGSGGMGTVYRALDESLQRYVALKVIRATSDPNVDARQVQRLLQEAIAQARVNHPNIAHIYYVGVEGNAPFFAMELINGPTLAQRLKDGPLSFAQVIDYAQQIIGALAHAAEFDILHGDIKPGNILLCDFRSDSGTVKLSDFGLARRLSEMDKETNSIAGTPSYLAPEAIAGNPLDVRSDMYALGVMLFEMTFGRLPYGDSGSSLSEQLRAHRERPVDFPDPWPNHVPLAWRAVLARLLNKNPSERYPTYGALLFDVARLKLVTLHPGARLPRALAWMVDIALTNTVQAVFVVPLTLAIPSLPRNAAGLLTLLAALLGIIAPLLASLLQSTWGKTPGKKLFQLRIVDRHGLTPRRSILFARMAVQLLPLWADINYEIWSALGMEYIALFTSGTLLLVTLADALCALFHKQKKSLHDLLFGTRVVLDTGHDAGAIG